MTEVSLYNVADGLTGRDGGPYLDQELMRAAEIRRAEVEGREPNFDNPASIAGVKLVTAQQLVDSNNVNSTPSQGAVDVAALAVQALVDNPDSPVKVASTIVDEVPETLEEPSEEPSPYSDLI